MLLKGGNNEVLAAWGEGDFRIALDGRRVVAIELAEVDLVDRDAVKLLARAEAKGIELRNCRPTPANG
jgi:hypothetical protein